MEEELNRKEVTRGIGNGFDVCTKYRVGLGWKNMEKWDKNTHFGYFRVTCTGTPWTCTGTPFQN